MPAQSRADPVPLLLTRPEPQGADFARAVTARFGDRVSIVKTPLLTPRFYAPRLPKGPFAGLVLTSQTGVDAYGRLGAQAAGLPLHAYCVGLRTADAARGAGLIPVFVAPDAAGLIAMMIAHPPPGAVLHLRGRETRGNIRLHLDSAGIETVDAVIYAQEQQPLTDDAQTILRAESPVLVPLFSPRTAAIFAAEVAGMRNISPLFVAAMSGDVALELAAVPAQIKRAQRPDQDAMLDILVLLLADMLGA